MCGLARVLAALADNQPEFGSQQMSSDSQVPITATKGDPVSFSGYHGDPQSHVHTHTKIHTQRDTYTQIIFKK